VKHILHSVANETVEEAIKHDCDIFEEIDGIRCGHSVNSSNLLSIKRKSVDCSWIRLIQITYRNSVTSGVVFEIISRATSLSVSDVESIITRIIIQ
jgi:hypothetical protein